MATRARDKTVSALPPLYGRVRDILQAARAGVTRTVNTTQVAANWLIGRKSLKKSNEGSVGRGMAPSCWPNCLHA